MKKQRRSTARREARRDVAQRKRLSLSLEFQRPDKPDSDKRRPVPPLQ